MTLGYLQLPTIDDCQHVSSLLYSLTRPISADDSTQYLSMWVQDNEGVWYLEWPWEITLPIHPDCSIRVQGQFDFLVIDNLMSVSSKEALQNVVVSNIGNTVTLQTLTMDEWLPLIKESINF